MAQLTVFDFSNYSEYLIAVGARRLSRQQRPLTYGQWARKLGYRSPRGIAMVLQEKRLPSADMVQRISTTLGHTELEHLYFEKLISLKALSHRGADTRAARKELSELNPKHDPTESISLEDFALIGQWYVLVIKQLIEAPGFREDPEWIRARTRGKISLVEARAALRVLGEIGWLARDPDGRLRVTRRSIGTPNDIACRSLRAHHREMALRGIEAIEEQEPDAREFTALTLRASPDDLPAIKDRLREFINQFDKKYERLDSSHVFQLNIQFFEHTQIKPRRPS